MRMTYRREAKASRKQSRRQKLAAHGALALATLFTLAVPGAQAAGLSVDSTNWGTLTAPVFGQVDKTPGYANYSPDLFAGPAKFGDGKYYHGVLPNGKIVNPAGKSVQIGMNPLGTVLTPDGMYLITSNDDERNSGSATDTGTTSNSLVSSVNRGGYSLSVVRTSDMTVVSQTNVAGAFFIGLLAKQSGAGYTIYASGGADTTKAGLNTVKVFTVSSAGAISPTAASTITISPILSSTDGNVSNYTPAASFNTADASGSKPPVPSQFSRAAGAKITFPAGSAFSPDGRYLYVACNGDNSLAVIDTTTNAVVKQIPVGYFPYGVSVSRDGGKILVANWGVMAYKFLSPTYDAGTGQLTSIGRISPGDSTDPLFFVPPTSTGGSNPQTSSVSVISVPGGDPTKATLLGSVYEGHGVNQDTGSGLDSLYNVGETHPSASAVVRKGTVEVLYVCKANSDSIGRILIRNNRSLPDFDLSPVQGSQQLSDHPVHGAYPNAIVVSPDNTRVYVAEAGLNTVAILDTTNPVAPKLLGRIPTGWYPTALSISPDGGTLYVANAKGVGEDINPNVAAGGTSNTTGIASFGNDSNYLFGTVQQVTNLKQYEGEAANTTALGFNVAQQTNADASVVPIGGAASTKIKHVFFIEQENKTFDSVLGSQNHFGPFASGTFNKFDGTPYSTSQFNGVSPNTQAIADLFAEGVNYYSDSEESDAGHQFCASGTATDYTEKTLLVKDGRGLLVNKNFEPEDYPESGYIFNNAARNGVSFKNYGELLRIQGTDTGGSTPTTINDPQSGNVGYPTLQADGMTVSDPLVNAGDVDTQTVGLGQSYFMKMPILQVLGTNNPNGESRLDRNFPGYNFNISDQRRAKEFIADFKRMESAGTLPTFLYIYLPNDHTGGVQAPNKSTVVTNSAYQQVADGDVALGMVVKAIMNSPTYYNSGDGTGSAIFMTYDDAQSTLDHIHPHRTPLTVVSPYAKPGYLGAKHYVTASIVKTEELMLGLPPNNLGDLFATDLRDLFQDTYNGITPDQLTVTRVSKYNASPEGKKVWSLVAKLDTSAPDTDSRRLGILARLSGAADTLHSAAVQKHHLHTAQYQAAQTRLYRLALKLVGGPAPRDTDD